MVVLQKKVEKGEKICTVSMQVRLEQERSTTASALAKASSGSMAQLQQHHRHYTNRNSWPLHIR